MKILRRFESNLILHHLYSQHGRTFGSFHVSIFFCQIYETHIRNKIIDFFFNFYVVRGFSVFSIVEIFYFLTLRPYGNYIKVSKKRRLTLNRMIKKIRRIRTRRIATPFLHSQVDNVDSPYHD